MIHPADRSLSWTPRPAPTRALRRASRLAVLVTAGSALAPAQTTPTWVRHDRYPATTASIVHDGARGRTVAWSGTTFEWDGTYWRQRLPRRSPASRAWPMLAYDEARQRVVLFGGFGGFDDTWEWDGADWVERSPATRPPARCCAAVAYDPQRQRLVMFGGQPAPASPVPMRDTWEWDGTDWLERRPTSTPPAAVGAVMAYDHRRQQILLYGVGSPYRPNDDTWSWNGTDWTRLQPASSPGSRVPRWMVADAARRRVVLFEAASAGSSRTWEWDGTTWQERIPVQRPDTRAGAFGMVFDRERQRVVLRVGSGALWEWDGTTWSPRSPAVLPSRIGLAMAYDAARDQVVLFRDAATWLWRDRWVAAAPATVPPARTDHAMVDVAHTGRVLLFGGSTAAQSFDDTWEWDGADWRVHPGAVRPAARDRHGVAYDAARRRVVLFGGRPSLAAAGPARSPLGDTWEWDGSAWTARTTAAAPAARAGHAMAYDQVRQRVVLFGGRTGAGPVADTWEWDGAAWQARRPSTSPPAREGARLVFDRGRGTVVLFGGAAGTAPPFFVGTMYDDTWEWDGTDWAPVAVASRPPARADHGMVYHAARGRVLVQDGSDYRSLVPFAVDGTWLFGDTAAAAVELLGAGCAGSRGVPQLAPFGLPARADPGFHLDLVSAAPQARAALLLSTAAGSLSIGGCTLWASTSGLYGCVPATTNGAGFATWALPVPDAAALIGIALVGQAAVDDPGAPFGLALTPALRLVVGE